MRESSVAYVLLTRFIITTSDNQIVDPDCDIAVATMAQLLLQQGKVNRALEYFERAASLSRTEAEIVNALSYAEATRTQLQVTSFVELL